MYITVRFLNNFSQELTYAVPKKLHDAIRIGTLVQVPLQKRIEAAIVTSINNSEQNYPFKIRYIDSIYPFPSDHSFHIFSEQLTKFYQTDQFYVIKRLKNFLTEKEDSAELSPLIASHSYSDKSIALTDEQETVYQKILNDVHAKIHATTVLHGVTGSGKTEIYKKLISSVITLHQAAMLLLPEVSLALQFERLLHDQLPDIEIFSFHSGSTIKQKKRLWQALLHNTPCLIIGVHLPTFLPIAHLGLIIIDEEHDAGYQEKHHPKIHSKNAALLKASILKIPVLLGSATPCVNSLWNVQTKGWKLLELKKRFAGQFPSVQIVSLSDKKERKNFWISSQLYQAIKQQLIKKEQTIIFINRRGFSFFVQCSACSFIFSCKNCSVSLTLHEDGKLICHYCNYVITTYKICPDCKGEKFLNKGIGTQQVLAILQKIFPQAIIQRADLDTTTKKQIWQQTLHDFYHKKIDILVGTQSISKGYHFPHVTLVGILWADINLHFPLYNAAETTLQQLIQVAGRAGRQSNESKVIVQTMTPHTLFNFIHEQNYIDFYQHEISKRKEVGYPPVKHIAEIEIRNTSQVTVEKDAQLIAHILIEKDLQNLVILGPVPAIIYRVKKTYCQKIYLKSTQRNCMISAFSYIKTLPISSSCFFTIDPIA